MAREARPMPRKMAKGLERLWANVAIIQYTVVSCHRFSCYPRARRDPNPSKISKLCKSYSVRLPVASNLHVVLVRYLGYFG